jgi:hypothetical protein
VITAVVLVTVTVGILITVRIALEGAWVANVNAFVVEYCPEDVWNGGQLERDMWLDEQQEALSHYKYTKLIDMGLFLLTPKRWLRTKKVVSYEG